MPSHLILVPPPPSLDPLQSSLFVTFVTSQRKRGLVLGGAMDPRANSATLLFGLITLITVCSPSSLICGFTRERTAVGHAAAVVGMPREGLQLRLRGGRRSLNLSEAIPVTEEDDLAQVRPVRVCASCKAPASAEADLRRCVWCKQAWYCSSECQRLDWPAHRLGCPPEKEDEIQLVEDTRKWPGEDNEGFGGAGPLPEAKRIRRRVMMGEDQLDGDGGRPGKLPKGWKLCISCRLPVQVPWIDCPACEAPISSAEYKEEEMYAGTDGRMLPMELNAEIAWANPGPQQDLFGACEEGDVQGIDAAVLAGANVSVPDKSLYDSTPLHYAASNGMHSAVSRLLELGADPNAPNEQGETPLFWACESGKSKVVKLLLEAGANATHENEWGETAIDIAASHGSLKIVGLLRDYGGEEADFGKDAEKDDSAFDDKRPPQDWEGGNDMETETVSALDESEEICTIKGASVDEVRRGKQRRGAKRGGRDDGGSEMEESDEVDRSGANSALKEGTGVKDRLERAASNSQRPFMREVMRRTEVLRGREEAEGAKEEEEAARALFGDEAVESVMRARMQMKEDDEARRRAGERNETTWERLADDGSVYAQVTAPTPEEMDRDIKRITESVADFNMDEFDPDRKRREVMAAQLRDAAADFAKRAAERRAIIDEKGVGDYEVPPVALPTAPPIEVAENLLSIIKGDGAKAGDGSMTEEEEQEEEEEEIF